MSESSVSLLEFACSVKTVRNVLWTNSRTCFGKRFEIKVDDVVFRYI